MARIVPLVLIALIMAVACGGGGSEEVDTSATVTSTPKRSASRSPTRAPTATLAPAAETVATTPEPGPTDPPAPAPTQAPVQPAAPTPAPANRAPSFPDPLDITTETSYEYDDEGYLTGAVTVITVSAASDLDGDALSYSWTASNGSISGAGLTATWTRVLDYGEPQAGTVTVTVSDGRGGSDVVEIDVQ